MNKQHLRKGQRWLLVLVIASILTATSIYIPALTQTVYACQHSGGGC